MANRRVSPEVEKLFTKYVKGHVRRLDRETALQLFQNEFSLSQQAAQSVFDYFDTDKTGTLTMWKFQHFYNLAGPRVTEIASQFAELDKETKGHLDRDTVKASLKEMKSADGKPLDDGDMEIILKTAKDENKITLGDFIAILYRVKLYKKPR